MAVPGPSYGTDSYRVPTGGLLPKGLVEPRLGLVERMLDGLNAVSEVVMMGMRIVWAVMLLSNRAW